MAGLWLVGLAWALYLWWRMPWKGIWHRWQEVSWPVWLAWLLLNLAVLAVQTWRFGSIVARFTARPSWWRLWVYRWAAFGVNYLTPGPQFGGEPLLVHWLHRREGLPRSQALAALMLEKAFELGSNLGFLLLAGGWWWLRQAHAPLQGSWWWGVLLALMGMVGYGWLVYRGWGPGMWLQPWLSAWGWGRFLLAVEHTLGETLRQHRRAVLVWTGLSFLNWVALVAEYGWLWHLMGVREEGYPLLTALVLTRLALLSPFPGGMGTLESAQYLAAHWWGWPAEAAAGVLVLMRLRDLTLALSGWGWALPHAQRWVSIHAA